MTVYDEPLTNSNFMLYAAKYYDNPGCLDMKEFQDDVNRIKYIKRLFNKYIDSNGEDLKERLILNHIIIFYNMFPAPAATRMLFLKLHDYLEYLKPFLIYISQCPTQVLNIGSTNSVIETVDIGLDSGIVKALRTIDKDDEDA